MLFLLPALALATIQSSSVETRVNEMLAKMTLDEKITMISDCDGYYTAAIPRLGIPRFKCSDGPVGLRLDGPTTAYPATVALAASFDPLLAARFGTAAGRDARARNVCIWWAPGVDLARIPQNGRNFEYLGEDPCLASQIVVPIIQAVQSQGVAATVKHFAVNDWENDRYTDSANVDERTLRELYLKPFQAAVQEGHAWCVMAAYNRLNGIYCSESDFLLNQVLKRDWGFKGMVVSDYDATHSTLPALKAGLDVEMPGEIYFSRAKIRPLVESGQLPLSTLDDKVRRILRVYYSMGFLDRTQRDSSIPKDDPANERVALDIAAEGTVLLKNKNHLLPIVRKRVRTLFVVGPNADPAVTGGGGSSYTTPAESISLLAAIRSLAGANCRVLFRSTALDLPSRAFAFQGFYIPGSVNKGLKMERFANMTLAGPAAIGNVGSIDIDKDDAHADQHFSVRWTADVRFPSSGDYMAYSRSDDGIRVFLDGGKLIDDWSDHGSKLDSASVRVERGRVYKLRVEYYQDSGASVAKFGFAPKEFDIEKELPVSEIKKADVVIAAVGFGPDSEGEGQDRTFALPGQQEEFVKDLVSLNPRTVVVNNSGAGVDMSGWVSKAGAILQAWYPGGIGNRAVAEILFGLRCPSGKLPTTFPLRLKGTYYEHAYPPVNHAITYKEGLFMGYRWFDSHKVAPLFPFGFGLSYTRFELSHCRVAADGGRSIWATAKLKNVGRRIGAEVVQVYVQPPGRIPRPIRELKGFERIELAPGRSETVAIEIDPDEFRYWSVGLHKWELEHGRYRFWIGTSSRDLPFVRPLNL